MGLHSQEACGVRTGVPHRPQGCRNLAWAKWFLVCGDIYKVSSLCLRYMACLGQRKRTSRVLSHLYSFYVDQGL